MQLMCGQPLLSTTEQTHGIFYFNFFVPHYNTISRFTGRGEGRHRERAATRQGRGGDRKCFQNIHWWVAFLKCCFCVVSTK